MKMKTTIKLCIGACLCMLLVSCSSTMTGFLKEPATIEQELENVQHSVMHEMSATNTVIDSTSSEPLQLRLADAVVMAMENNPSLAVSKFGPALQRTREDVAGAVFDPIDVPDIKVLPLEAVEAHVITGLNQRPEIQQAMLEVEKNELEVIRTRNGLLPKLDLFVRLGNSSYANSFSSTEDEDGDNTSWTVGVQFEYALGRRAEKAAHRYAQLSVIQTEYALENMKHLAQLDIRIACVEVKRASAQINASTATRKLREEVLRTEEGKFRVGRSTALLVSQASRDLLTSQIDEVEAVIAYRKALLELYRTEGTLLNRRGIALQ